MYSSDSFWDKLGILALCLSNNRFYMRTGFYLFVILVLLFVGSGCPNNKTRVGERAGIGGVIVADGGSAVGAQMEKSTPDNQVQPTGHLTMQQIVDLTKQRISSDDIISKINVVKPSYALTENDIAYLRKENVS